MLKIPRYTLRHSNFDTIAVNVIVLHIYILICKNMLVNVNDFFYRYNDRLNAIIMVSFGIMYSCLVLSGLLSRLRTKTIFVLLLMLLFVAVTFTIDSERFISNVFPYSYVKTQFRTFISYCLPLFIVVSSLDSLELLLRKLYDTTQVPFIFATCAFILSLFPHENGVYMSYGNAVLTISLLLLFKYSHTKAPMHMVQFVLTCIYILISGSRGPIVSLAVAFFLVLFVLPDKKNVLLILIFCILTFVVVMFYDEILNGVIKILDRLNINSRTISMLLSGKIGSNSNRSIYHKKLLDKLYQSPIIGLGAFGGEATVGLAHSWYLDVLANFGFFGGAVFILCIVLKDVFLIVKNKHTAISELLLIFSVFLFPRGFFDDSFWGSKEMWMIFAIFIQASKHEKQVAFDYIHYKRIHFNWR